MHRIAQPQLFFQQQFAAVGIEHDILRCREKGDGGRQIGDRPDIDCWPEQPECRNRQQQSQL